MTLTTLRRGLSHMVLGILGLAGVLKLLDLAQFASDLGTWSLLPPGVLRSAVLGVPICEVGLCGFWFLGGFPRWVRFAVLIVLPGFTLVYAAHLLLVGPPTCGCFGKWNAYLDMKGHSWVLIARNITMIACVLVWPGCRQDHTQGVIHGQGPPGEAGLSPSR